MSSLVPVSKRVTRLGKTFEQRYWIRDRDLQQMVQARGGMAIVEQIGGDEALASRMIDNWASMDGPKSAQNLIGGAARAFGLSRTVAAAGLKSATKVDLAYGDKRAVSTAAALARISKSAHEDDVTLYRVVRQKPLSRSGGKIKVATRAIASFSESQALPMRYAKYLSSPDTYVVELKIPRESIALSWRAFKGAGFGGKALRDAKEVVIATKGAVTGRVVWEYKAQ